jgi:uncharacterized protein
MNKIISVLFLLLFILSSCSKQTDEMNGQQIANPAAVYCEQQGGTLRIEQTEAGQYGICVLPNGTECEEWAYYRGECS